MRNVLICRMLFYSTVCAPNVIYIYEYIRRKGTERDGITPPQHVNGQGTGEGYIYQNVQDVYGEKF